MSKQRNYLRCFYGLRVERALIDDQTWAHGGAQGYALDVDAFRSRWLQTLEVRNQRFNVLLQLLGVKTNLADGTMDDAVLVSTETYLTSLAFFTAVATSGVTVPTFGLGIRPRGPST